MGDNGSIFCFSSRHTECTFSAVDDPPRPELAQHQAGGRSGLLPGRVGGLLAPGPPPPASRKSRRPDVVQTDVPVGALPRNPGGEQTPSFPSQSCPLANAQGLWVHTALAPPPHPIYCSQLRARWPGVDHLRCVNLGSHVRPLYPPHPVWLGLRGGHTLLGFWGLHTLGGLGVCSHRQELSFPPSRAQSSEPGCPAPSAVPWPWAQCILCPWPVG